jgi:hypothetical protein
LLKSHSTGHFSTIKCELALKKKEKGKEKERIRGNTSTAGEQPLVHRSKHPWTTNVGDIFHHTLFPALAPGPSLLPPLVIEGGSLALALHKTRRADEEVSNSN